MRENRYQASLINKLDDMFPGCLILKNDSNYRQGIPDLIILFNEKWAMLEVKASRKAPSEPNQDWYVGVLDSMSFAAFIYPENEEDVLNDLQRTFETRRPTRLSKR